jgi:hypothetical protein
MPIYSRSGHHTARYLLTGLELKKECLGDLVQGANRQGLANMASHLTVFKTQVEATPAHLSL